MLDEALLVLSLLAAAGPTTAGGSVDMSSVAGVAGTVAATELS